MRQRRIDASSTPRRSRRRPPVGDRRELRPGRTDRCPTGRSPQAPKRNTGAARRRSHSRRRPQIKLPRQEFEELRATSGGDPRRRRLSVHRDLHRAESIVTDVLAEVAGTPPARASARTVGALTERPFPRRCFGRPRFCRFGPSGFSGAKKLRMGTRKAAGDRAPGRASRALEHVQKLPTTDKISSGRRPAIRS